MFQAPNYTQIPNFLLDTLMLDLSHLELKILLFICRKTFGWHKIRDHISLSQFEKNFHSSRSHLKDALDSLAEKKLIIITQEGCQKDGTLKNYYQLIIIDPSAERAPPPSAQNDTTPSAPRAPTKETSTKEKEEEREGKEEAAPPPLSPQFRYKRLKMQRSRYNSLVFQHGEEKVKRFMDELDEYADVCPKKFREYGDHSIVLARWIRREEEYMPSRKTAYRGHQDALEVIKKIEKLCLPAYSAHLQTGIDYVHFIQIPGAFLKADDPTFPLVVETNLRKLKIPIEWIKKIFNRK